MCMNLSLKINYKNTRNGEVHDQTMSYLVNYSRLQQPSHNYYQVS